MVEDKLQKMLSRCWVNQAFWSCGILSAVVISLFYRVVFKGEHISRLGFLSKVDAFFNPSIKEAIVPLVFDPTSYLGFWPQGHFSFYCWFNRVLPLWNPYLGCGYPHAGDPQCYWFSPLNFIYAFAGTPFSDFVVVGQCLLAALGTLILARRAGITWLASIWCGATFAFCPRILAVSDLRNNEFLLPWVLVALITGISTFSIRRIVMAAVAVALLIISSHPESSFFSVVFGALYAFLLSSLTCSYRKTVWRRAVLRALSALVAVGFFSFCFSAPVILPFLEFLSQASFYKDISGAAVQPPAVLLNGLSYGQGEQACFVGIAFLALIAVGLLGSSPIKFALEKFRLSKPVLKGVSPAFIEILIAAIIAFAAFPPAVAQGLLSVKPICYLAPYYAEPVMLLMLIMAGARGLDVLSLSVREKNKHLSKIFVLLALLSFVFYIWHITPLPTVHSFESLVKAVWHAGKQERWFSLCYLVLNLVACLLIFLPLKFKRLAVLSIVAISISTSYYVAKECLLPMPAISAVRNKVTEYLQQQGGRIAATGSNFFLPNTNLLVSLPDLRCFSPFHPQRYEKFLEAAGAKRHNLFFFSLPDQLNHLIDLGSVEHVVTRRALLNAVASSGAEKAGSIPLKTISQGKVCPGLRIVDAEVWFDPYNSEFHLQCRWRLHKMAEERYAIQYFVVPNEIVEQSLKSLSDLLAGGASGKVSAEPDKTITWVGNKEFFAPPDALTHEVSQTIALPVPKAMVNLPQLSSLNLGFVIWDTWTGQYVPMDGKRLCRWQESAIVSRYEPGVTDAETSRQDLVLQNSARRFNLEFEDDGIRVYRNNQALPPAYLVHEVKLTHNAQQSLDLILSGDTDWTQVAVIEVPDSRREQKILNDMNLRVNGDMSNAKTATLSLIPFTKESVSLRRPDNNSCVVAVDSQQPGYLILTDTMYPGWSAELDGHPVPIFRANYLFRGIAIPPGRHTVLFAYRPVSVAWSLLLFALGAVGAVSLLLRPARIPSATVVSPPPS